MRPLILALALTLTGCESILGCDEEIRTIEVAYNDPFSEFSRGQVDRAREQGFDCEGETMRNAFGNIIGTRYTCTKCR